MKQLLINIFKKKCVACKNILPIRRSRFCTDTCAKRYGMDRVKRIRARFKLDKKKCGSCGKKFQPKVPRHVYCSPECWDIINAERQAEKRRQTIHKPNVRKSHRFKNIVVEGVKPVFVRETQFTKATTLERVKLQGAVEEYLAEGGVIKRYILQPIYNDEINELRWGVTEKEEDEVLEMYK